MIVRIFKIVMCIVRCYNRKKVVVHGIVRCERNK
jgi:hypothetical protein